MSESKLVKPQEMAFHTYYCANKCATECYEAIRKLTDDDTAITELLEAFERYVTDRAEVAYKLKQTGFEEDAIQEIVEIEYGNK